MIKLLSFFRIIDEYDKKLSITNCAVIIVLIKLTLAPNTSVMDTGALFIAMASYAYKKHINKDIGAPKQEDLVTPRIAQLEGELKEASKKFSDVESKISAIALQAGIKKLTGS
jgi:hypothetical protein